MFPAAYCDKVNKYKQMVYGNKVYRGIVLHYTYSLWAALLLDPAGDFFPPAQSPFITPFKSILPITALRDLNHTEALPLDPAGRLPSTSPDSLVSHYTRCYCILHKTPPLPLVQLGASGWHCIYEVGVHALLHSGVWAQLRPPIHFDQYDYLLRTCLVITNLVILHFILA